MFRSSTDKQHKKIKQIKINHICSCLLLCKIRTSKDLIDNHERILEQILQNPKIFKTTYTAQQCYQIFQSALDTYNSVNGFTIRLPKPIHCIPAFEKSKQKNSLHQLDSIDANDDLARITSSYDRFSASFVKKGTISKGITEILKDKEFVVCPHVIVGAGDTGTTLWLEKYKPHHKTTEDKLSQGQLPAVLMIGDGSGSWKHDYTLAQPHSILERTTSKANPSDYVSRDYYLRNPYANGRHVYQANQVSLVKTEAPLLQATVLKIEKKNLHVADWKCNDNNYRLIVMTPAGTKAIYTNEINICTGLGPARNAIAGTVINDVEFQQLSKFDQHKQFTPIVDGNQFILTGSEEVGKKQRTIVVYGGGGTAAACYRKGFFGHDVRTEGRAFQEDGKKHTVLWMAKQFNKAGTGKLATNALKSAKERNELFHAELLKIEPQPNGKIKLLFSKTCANTGSVTSEKFQVDCDQFVYSIGQNDSCMRNICAEIDSDLHFNFDSAGMPLNVSTSDKKVCFFGAAAMAVRENAYISSTWKWLGEQNIGGDVGPGSMPPSRAQIKRHNSLEGIFPDSINANMDSNNLIVEYLSRAGIPAPMATAFTCELLIARKHRTAGCTPHMLKDLLVKHALDKMFEIYGLGHIVLKPKPKQQPHNNANTARLFAAIDKQEDENSYVRTDQHNNTDVEDKTVTIVDPVKTLTAGNRAS